MTEVDQLRAQLDALATRLRLVEDQLELAQLVARYGPAVDSGAADAAAALWADDGSFIVPPIATWTGHEAIAGMINGDGHQSLIHNGVAHVLTAPRVVVDGDTARGWNYALNIRWDAAEQRFWVARVSANEWHWRRNGNGWRTVSRENRNLDGTEEPRTLLHRSTE
jgi:ketosteroid isomerase-like protein